MHLYVTSPDTLADLKARLDLNTTQPDVFVSTTAVCAEYVREAIKDFPYPVQEVEVVPAKAGDFGALLSGFAATLVKGYDIIGHLPVCDREDAATDRFVLSNFLGDDVHGAMLDRTLTAMAGNVALVFPDDPDVMSWRACRPVADRLARQMGLGPLPDQINFPTQNTFWVKSATLARLTALELGWGDYPLAPHNTRSTILSALPRLLAVLPGLDDQQVVVTNLRGVTR